MRDYALFYLNGIKHEVGREHASLMLADYLRYVRGLTGTKIVCAEGDCGACSVLRLFPLAGAKTYESINACIMTVAQVDGSSLVTVDALAEEGKPSPVQNAMMKCHGSQCGFCTPGFVVALTGLVEKKIAEKGKEISNRDALNALTGNLCRCTGYQPILEAAQAIDLTQCRTAKARYYSKAQEAELMRAAGKALHIEHGTFRFFAPISLKEACAFLSKNPDSRVIGAATDIGVFHNKGKREIGTVVSLHLILELYEAKIEKKTRITVGSRVTLTELREVLKNQAPEIARFLDLFASPQIKNVATLAGNVANASPIGDTTPFLMAMNASIEAQGPKGKRAIPIEEFFVGYRQTALRKGELIRAISFDLPGKSETFHLKKMSERKDLDISSVNAGFRLVWSDAKKARVDAVRVAVGGVAATPLRLKKTEKVLTGKPLSPETIELAARTLQEEIGPISDVRGSAAFRRVLLENAFRRFIEDANTGAKA